MDQIKIQKESISAALTLEPTLNSGPIYSHGFSCKAINPQSGGGQTNGLLNRHLNFPFAVTINQCSASLTNPQIIPEKRITEKKKGREGKEEREKGGREKNQYLSKPSNIQKLDLITLALDQNKPPSCAKP